MEENKNNEKEQKRQSILKTIEEKGEEWMIAAMIHGSTGYHTPKHAKIILDRFRAGNVKDYCERCDACFGNDLIEMLDYDIRLFKYKEEVTPEKAKALVNFARQAAGLDTETQSSISMLYPTMGL